MMDQGLLRIPLLGGKVVLIYSGLPFLSIILALVLLQESYSLRLFRRQYKCWKIGQLFPLVLCAVNSKFPAMFILMSLDIPFTGLTSVYELYAGLELSKSAPVFTVTYTQASTECKIKHPWGPNPDIFLKGDAWSTTLLKQNIIKNWLVSQSKRAFRSNKPT